MDYARPCEWKNQSSVALMFVHQHISAIISDGKFTCISRQHAKFRWNNKFHLAKENTIHGCSASKRNKRRLLLHIYSSSVKHMKNPNIWSLLAGLRVQGWNVAKDVEIADAPLGEASNELNYCCILNNESLEQAPLKQLAKLSDVVCWLNYYNLASENTALIKRLIFTHIVYTYSKRMSIKNILCAYIQSVSPLTSKI